jgi:hypothetical protein
VGWQTDSSIQVISCTSGACNIEDSLYRLQPVVAPRLPVPPQLAPDLKLKPAERSALVTAVGDASALRVSAFFALVLFWVTRRGACLGSA